MYYKFKGTKVIPGFPELNLEVVAKRNYIRDDIYSNEVFVPPEFNFAESGSTLRGSLVRSTLAVTTDKPDSLKRVVKTY